MDIYSERCAYPRRGHEVFVVCRRFVVYRPVTVDGATRFKQEGATKKFVQGVSTGDAYIFPIFLSQCDACLCPQFVFIDKYEGL